MMVDLIEVARRVEWWAIKRYRRQPMIQRGELLGISWEAASRAPAEFALSKATFAVRDLFKRPEPQCAALPGDDEPTAVGREDERHEPDRFEILARRIDSARLTPKQADALRGWMHGASLASESVRLGVSKDRVSQLRFRALERLGGAP